MIGIEHIFFAVGFGFGVVFATICLTISTMYDDYFNDLKRIKENKRDKE